MPCGMLSSIPVLYPLDASSKPPSSLIVVTTQICVQMSPGVEVGGGGWGWEQKSHMLENYWPIINRKKKFKMNWRGKCCFLLVLIFQYIELDHRLHLRDSAF